MWDELFNPYIKYVVFQWDNFVYNNLSKTLLNKRVQHNKEKKKIKWKNFHNLSLLEKSILDEK